MIKKINQNMSLPKVSIIIVNHNGKTLLEKNYANVFCRYSKTRSGAEVSIKWNNKDLLSL